MKTQEKIKQAFNTHKRVEIENEYTPQPRTGDLKRFWDNYNSSLVERISTIKASK